MIRCGIFIHPILLHRITHWRKANYLKSICFCFDTFGFCFVCFLLVRIFMMQLYTIRFYFTSTFLAFFACLYKLYKTIHPFLCYFIAAVVCILFLFEIHTIFKHFTSPASSLFPDNLSISSQNFAKKYQEYLNWQQTFPVIHAIFVVFLMIRAVFNVFLTFLLPSVQCRCYSDRADKPT